MSNEFEKIFEKLARTDDPNVIFTNFLDYVIDQNLFTMTERNLDFKGHEEDYFNLFSAWVNIQNDYFENNPDKAWYDYLGLFYEDIIQSKYRAGTRGQFFTPANVCQTMAELTFASYTNKNKELDGILINDCACGSGRLLLDAHSKNRNAILIGQDLDPVACKMAVLNFYISGVTGSIIHQNTLTLEVYEAWRVNKYINHGLPIPHIELVNERDAYRFIGIKKEKPVELNKPVIENYDKPQTVQSKLM